MYLNFVNTDNNNIYITNQLFMSSDATHWPALALVR